MSSENLGASALPGQFRELPSVSMQRVDEMLDCLADRKRRVALVLLNRGAVDSEADLIYRGKEETKATLVHTHLPKLAEAGYIEWDRESGTIEKGPQFDEIEPLLDLIEENADELPHDWP